MSPRDLGAILWSGRFVLLGSLLIGVAWGFLILPPGTMAVRSRIEVDLLGDMALPTNAVDPWSVLLQTSDLAEAGSVEGVTVVRSPERLTLTLTSIGDAAHAHGQLVDRIERSLAPASDALLDVLGASTGAAAPYVADARTRPGGAFGLHAETSRIAPRGVLALHLRFVLIALGAGTAATFILHLLGAVRRRLQIAQSRANS